MRRVRRRVTLRPEARTQLRTELRRVAVAVGIAWLLTSLLSVVYATLSALLTGLWSIATTLVLVVSVAGAGVILALSAGLILLAVWLNESPRADPPEVVDRYELLSQLRDGSHPGVAAQAAAALAQSLHGGPACLTCGHATGTHGQNGECGVVTNSGAPCDCRQRAGSDERESEGRDSGTQ